MPPINNRTQKSEFRRQVLSQKTEEPKNLKTKKFLFVFLSFCFFVFMLSDYFCIAPEIFQVVKSSYRFIKYMDDYITVIKENPPGLSVAFNMI